MGTGYLGGLLLLWLVSHRYTDTAAIRTCNGETCQNGLCGDSGCLCLPCWTGGNCDTYTLSGPRFNRTQYNVRLPIPSAVGSEVTTVHAAIQDDFCGQQNNKVEYIIKASNESRFLAIDADTGLISVACEEIYVFTGRTITLQVEARVRTDHRKVTPPDGGNTANVTIEVYDRKKEQQGQDKTGNPAVVSEMTFHMTKLGDSENVTELQPGSRQRFRLQLHFPAGMTDMRVELFTPTDKGNITMVIDAVEIKSCGRNLLQCSDILSNEPEMIAWTWGKDLWDTAVLDLGYITNSNKHTESAEDSIITIEWDAVMLPQNDLSVNGSTIWVNAGAEYMNDSHIWVAGEAMVARTDRRKKPDLPLPEIKLSGPDTVETGQTTKLLLNMSVPHLSARLTVDAFSPVNTSQGVTVAGARVIGYGTNILHQQRPIITQTHFSQATGGVGSLSLPLGKVLNKVDHSVVREMTSDDVIQLEILLRGSTDVSLVGARYLVGVAVEINSDLIWASQYSVQLINENANSISQLNDENYPDFNMKFVDSSEPPPGADAAVPSNSSPEKYREAQFEVITQPGVVYHPVDMEAFVPRESLYNITKLRISHLGHNLAYINMTSVEKSVTPRYSDDGRRVVAYALTLGVVYNQQSADLPQHSDHPAADKIIVTVGVTTLNTNPHPEATGTDDMLSFGVFFHPRHLWIGQLNLNVGPRAFADHGNRWEPHMEQGHLHSESENKLTPGGTMGNNGKTQKSSTGFSQMAERKGNRTLIEVLGGRDPEPIKPHTQNAIGKVQENSKTSSKSKVTSDTSVHTGSPAIHDGSPAIHDDSPAVQDGSPAIHDDSPAVQDDSPAVQDDSPAVQDGSDMSPAVNDDHKSADLKFENIEPKLMAEKEQPVKNDASSSKKKSTKNTKKKTTKKSKNKKKSPRITKIKVEKLENHPYTGQPASRKVKVLNREPSFRKVKVMDRQPASRMVKVMDGQPKMQLNFHYKTMEGGRMVEKTKQETVGIFVDKSQTGPTVMKL